MQVRPGSLTRQRSHQFEG